MTITLNSFAKQFARLGVNALKGFLSNSENISHLQFSAMIRIEYCGVVISPSIYSEQRQVNQCNLNLTSAFDIAFIHE